VLVGSGLGRDGTRDKLPFAAQAASHPSWCLPTSQCFPPSWCFPS